MEDRISGILSKVKVSTEFTEREKMVIRTALNLVGAYDFILDKELKLTDEEVWKPYS